MPEDSTFLHISKYIDQHGLEILNISVNGFLYATAGILFGLDKKIFWDSIESQTVSFLLLGIGFLFNIYFYYRHSKRSKSNLELSESNEKNQEKIQLLENQIQQIHRNYSEIFNEHLASLFFKLGLKDTERISMYKFQNEKFYIIGRYSSNPVLRKVRRIHYKSDQGLIAKAWREGEFFLNSGVPEYGSKAKNKRAIHSFFNQIHPIDKQVLDEMTMKSKSFYLQAFMDSKGIQRTSIIVIESENNKAFEKEILARAIREEENKLNAFVDNIEWNFPTLDKAQNSGF